MMYAALAAYQRVLASSPLRTNLCTAVPFMVVGDVVAQNLEPGRSAHDYERTLVMSAYSGLIFTPTFYHLYRIQESVIVGSRLYMAVGKTLGSIVVGGVPVNLCFLSLATGVEILVFGKTPTTGETCSEVVSRKVRNDLPRVMLGSLGFWGPINFCNFMFTPPKFRIIVVSCSAVVWNCYLSLVQHEYVQKPRPAAGARGGPAR